MRSAGDSMDHRSWARRLCQRVEPLLLARHLPLLVAGLAVLVTLPSLGSGLFFDDWHYRLLMQNHEGPVTLLRSPLDAFRLFNGDPEQNLRLIDYGFLPWWADPAVKWAFWRPLASLTHWLDYLLWPESPALMHVQSILWYAILTAVATLLYRRLIGRTLAAGLAAILYAVDDAHGTPVCLLANRNALIAAFFGVLCLLVHDRWRRRGWRAGALLGPLLLGLSLLAKEEGIATLAYLAAFALFLDPARKLGRAATLIPYVVVVAAWRAVWVHLGYGVANVGLYVDPLSEPFRFVCALALRTPVYLLGLLATPPSDVPTLLEGNAELGFVVAAAAFAALVIIVCWPLLRQNQVVRFWFTGLLLSLVPIGTMFPSDRVLLFAGLGGMALVAEFLNFLLTSPRKPRRAGWRASATVLACVFVLAHLVIAPPGLAFGSSGVALKWLTQRCSVPAIADREIERQDLVIVNPPAGQFVMFSELTWASQNAPMPAHVRVLASSLGGPLEIHRSDSWTLLVRPQAGFLAWKIDRVWRGPAHAFTIGDKVQLTGMAAEVLALTQDGRPAEVAFRFETPLEDIRWRWLQWKEGAFRSFVPPPVGTSLWLDSE